MNVHRRHLTSSFCLDFMKGRNLSDHFLHSFNCNSAWIVTENVTEKNDLMNWDLNGWWLAFR